MAFPQFSAPNVTNLVFSRGNSFPTERIYEPVQITAYSEAGQARVATLADPREFFPLVFERLPTADVDALITFLSDPDINWAAESFTYTDTTGATFTVRFVDGSFTRQQVASGLYNVRLLLRREFF